MVRYEKAARVGSDPVWPGGYKGYVKVRAETRKYKKTPQQMKIAAAGREAAKECKGKHGSEFKECRTDIMQKHGWLILDGLADHMG